MVPLALSSLGVVSCLGSGQVATVAALRAARTGLRPCDFELAPLPTFIGRVAGLEDEAITGPLAAYDCRNNRLVRRALDQDGFAHAVGRARHRYGPTRVGVFVGTSTAGILESENAFRRRSPETGLLPTDFNYQCVHNNYGLAAFVQRSLGLEGPALVISAACASTAKIFAVASRMISVGLCDAAVVGGADSLCLTTLYGFHSLQLTATGPCRPFDEERDGISVGEAAGFVLLEREDRCASGSGLVLLGVGESSDAYHMSSPHPEGVGARRAMESALVAAGLSSTEIDYVNLHGTATKVGDRVEDHAVSAVFGNSTRCSSTKGLTGHTLGASGVLEAIIAGLGLIHGFIPASPTTRRVDPSFHANYVAAGLVASQARVMTNSFGFGGSNCSLIFGKSR